MGDGLEPLTAESSVAGIRGADSLGRSGKQRMDSAYVVTALRGPANLNVMCAGAPWLTRKGRNIRRAEVKFTQ